jgi:dihydroxyacetone kinase
MRAVGGTSGPLYAAFLLRGATAMARQPTRSARAWADAFQAGVDAVSELGGARPGDRTMLDALHPACAAVQDALTSGAAPREALARGVEAARRGADATASMTARRGRSSYLGERALGHPDPGAVAVVTWLEAIAGALR